MNLSLESFPNAPEHWDIPSAEGIAKEDGYN